MLITNNRTKWLTVALALLLFLTISSPISMASESPQPLVSQAGSATSAQTMNQQRYADVPDTAWYAEAVNTWVMLGILKPKEGDKLNPQLVMTRGDFAKYLAISLDLSPSKSASPFKDMAAGGELTGYVAALHDAGLAKGYTDGTFRPSLKITRAEVASLIATAKKLKPEPQAGSGFRDVPQNSWYAGAVGALTKAGIANGKSKTSFAPNANIVLVEGISLLYRTFFSPSIIQDIGSDGTIKIDGQTYRVGASVQGIFQPSNKAVLHNAAIQFTAEGNTINSVEGLIIGYKDALADMAAPIIFDANGNTVNGTVMVSSNQVAVAHLKVKGDLNLTPAVQSDFFAFNVLVQGKTVFLKDNGRPKSQITNIWFEHSDLGQLYLFNSALVKKVDISADKTSKSSFKSKGEVSTLAATTDIQDLYVSFFNRPADTAGLQFWQDNINASSGTAIMTGNGFQGFNEGAVGGTVYSNVFGREPDSAGLAFWSGAVSSAIGTITGGTGVFGDSNAVRDPMQFSLANVDGTIMAAVDTVFGTDASTTLGSVTVRPGVSVQFTSQTPIGTLIIGNSDTVDHNPSGSTSFTGLGNIGQATVFDNAGLVTLTSQGTIAALQTTGVHSQLVLGTGTTINNLIVPAGVNPAEVFVNGNDFSNVKAVNGKSTAPTPSPNPSPESSPNPNNPNPNNPDPNNPDPNSPNPNNPDPNNPDPNSPNPNNPDPNNPDPNNGI